MGRKKKTSEQPKKNESIFNLEEEVVIGINSPKAVENKKKALQAKKKQNNNYSKNEVKSKEKKTNLQNKTNNQTKKKNAQNKPVKKQNPKLKVFFKWTILIILLIASIIFFLMSPLFNIREISVSGENKVSASEIESLSGLSHGQNIFNFSKIKAKENIKQNPYIATVEINRILPYNIKIEVTERKPSFLIEKGSSYIYIDNQGYALEISEEKLELPILTSLSTDIVTFKPGDRLEKSDLLKLDDIILILDTAKSNGLYDKIISIDMKDSSNYILTLTDNKTAYIGDITSINMKILYLNQILEKEQGIEGTIYLDKINTKEVYFREKI